MYLQARAKIINVAVAAITALVASFFFSSFE